MKKIILLLSLFITSILFAAAPTLTNAPSDVTVVEDTSSTIDLSALVFSDADGDDLIVRFVAINGTFAVSSSNNVSISGNGSREVSFNASPSEINSYFDDPTSVRYLSSQNLAGENADSFQIIVNDLTTGDAVLATINIDITGVNDSPTADTTNEILSIEEDSEYSYKLIANDIEGDEIDWNINGTLPSWLELKEGIETYTIAGNGTIGLNNADTALDATFTDINGIVSDSSGNIYVSERENHIIRKIDSQGIVSTYAGSGGQGLSDDSGSNASFNNPSGLAIDSLGNIYVADSGNNIIRKIDTSRNVTSVSMDGTLDEPRDIALDSSGNIYIADTGNNLIKKINTSGELSVVAGSGNKSFANGNGVLASFDTPTSLTIDSNGNIFVADSGNNMIRKIDSSNEVTTFAGDTTSGYTDANGTSARFFTPVSISIDSSDNLYVIDRVNNRIRKIDSNALVSTFAGNGTASFVDGSSDEASFNFSSSTLTSSGAVFAYEENSIYIADTLNRRVRKVIDENRLIGTPLNEHVGNNDISLIVIEKLDNTASNEYNFTISVSNTNDTPTDISLSHDTINQSEGLNALIGSLSTSDVDVGDTFSYNLVSGDGSDHNSYFNIASNELRVNNSADLEGEYKIRIKSSDSASASFEKEFIITIVDDVSPVITNVMVPSANTYIENNDLIFQINTNEIINVSGTPRLILNINGNTKYAEYTSGANSKELIFKYTIETNLLDLNGINLETAIDINGATLQDEAGNDLVLTLNSVGSTASLFIDSVKPEISSFEPVLDEENVELNSNLTLRLSEEVKVGSGNIYIKKYADDSVFETIDISSSQVTINNQDITIEHNNEYPLNTLFYIEIDSGALEDNVGNDFAGISSKDTWKFTSINNYAPIITSNSSSTSATLNVDENTTVVGTFTATDADNHNLTWSIEGSDIAFFSMGSNSGELNFIVAPNYELKNTYDISVRVTDDGEIPLSDIQNLTVSINDINEKPIVTSSSTSTAIEDTSYTHKLEANDEDGNHLLWSIKSGETLPSWLSLRTQEVTTYAGNKTSGSLDASGSSASFFYPKGMFIDSSGNIYLADSFNNKIRKIDTMSNVTTLTINTSLSSPQDIVLDTSLNMYIADTANNLIKKIDTSGNVSILTSNVKNPQGLAIDSSGNLYVADTGNNKIIKITSLGIESTIAGGASIGYKDGDSSTALFNSPTDVALDSMGNIIVADKSNNRIRKIDSSGNVTTLVGGDTNGVSSGDLNAKGTAARFNAPTSLAIDGSDNIYVTDSLNNKIRKIDKSFTVTTLSDDDFNSPSGVAVNSDGNIFISDSANNRIRKIEEINSLLGTPTNSDIGIYPINLLVSDGGFDIDYTFNLTVKNVNDEPTIIMASSLSLDEDNSADLIFSFSDIDGDTVTTSQKTAPLNGSISINGTTITYTPNTNFNGSDSFVLDFTDNAGFNEEKTVSVTVKAIDDSPVLSSTLSAETQYEDSEGLIIDLSSSNISVTDVDNDESTVVYSVSSSDETIAKAFIENNRLIIVPISNASGSITITLSATINGLSDTHSFTYTLNAINDAPSIEVISDVSVVQSSSPLSGSIDFDIWDDSTLPTDALSISSEESNFFSSLEVVKNNETQGSVNYTLASNVTGETAITLTIKDSSNLEYKEIFDFQVKTSNDALCVENSKIALNFDILKQNNITQNSINTNLNLPTTLENICDVSISWDSSDESLISNTGVVNNLYGSSVILIATISKGEFSSKKYFLFTVVSSDILTNDLIDNILFDTIRGDNTRKDEIVSNLELITSISGENISWTSSDESVINPYTGVVNRSIEDKDITLSANIGSESKEFILKVLKTQTDYEMIVSNDKELLSYKSILGENEDSDNVIYNLNKPLPLNGYNGSRIEWSSSNESVISVDGDVTRDLLEDKYVLLTAELRKGTAYKTKEFILKVKKNSIEENLDTTFKTIDTSSEDRISLVVVEDGTNIDTSASFDSTLVGKLENMIDDESIKTNIELDNKLLNLFINSDGSSHASMEINDDENDSKLSSLYIKDTGSTTSIDADGNISTTLTSVSNKFDLMLKSDGGVLQTIENLESLVTNQLSSSIEGSDLILDSDGNSQLVSEVIDSNYIYNLIVNTDSMGKTTTKILQKNLMDGSLVNEDLTLDDDFTYNTGNSVEIKMVNDKYYIETKTTLDNAITIK